MTDLVTIDCEYLHPKFAAAYLRTEDGRAAFIENNTARATDKLLRALTERKLQPEQVEYLIVTHAHLDHAGGTSALLAHCPNAQVLAHPKAARTLIDPARLVASAKRVYGEAAFGALYGEIRPIAPERVRAVADGETIRFGNSELRFFYTKGHATHHFCIHDPATRSVFTGDAFGLAYPALQSHGLFIFPSTSPIDFDPPEAIASADRIAKCGADRAYLTHFGEVRDLAAARAQLVEHLEAHARVLEEAKASPLQGKELSAFCGKKLQEHFTRFFERKGWRMSADLWNLLKLDLELNADGIAFVARRPPKELP